MEGIIATVFTGIVAVVVCVLTNKYNYNHLKEVIELKLEDINKTLTYIQRKVDRIVPEDSINSITDVLKEMEDLNDKVVDIETRAAIVNTSKRKVGRDPKTGRFVSIAENNAAQLITNEEDDRK